MIKGVYVTPHSETHNFTALNQFSLIVESGVDVGEMDVKEDNETWDIWENETE